LERFDSIIIRYGGEIGIKADWTRRAYERRLVANIKRVLKHRGVTFDRIVRKFGRFFLKTSATKEAMSIVSRVFGVSSVSAAVETSSKLEDIVANSLELAGSGLKRGSRFAVRCRRTGDHAFSSVAVCRVVGQHILEKFADRGVKVDLKDPDFELGVEVRDDRAFLYSDVVKGVGGMPLGTQPRLVGLLSGGLDSAVACWLVMKRGCPVVPVYFNNTPFTDERTTQRALDTAKVLFKWAVGFSTRVYVVPNGENLEEFRRKCPKRLVCLLCKRMMYRIAERIADMENAEGIVTGEAIGEQASQTLRNLRVLDSAADKYPVHRPLLGFDKAETERVARKIGTYRVAIKEAKGCTAVSNSPRTAAKLGEVEEAEKSLNIEALIQKSFNSLKKINL
jgi:thiamine biosynthesis protein ThiI